MSESVGTQPVVAGIGEVLWDLLPGGRRLGGAPINFALHAAALGARAFALSAVGEDALGAEARARLESAGVNVRLLTSVPGFATGTVTVSIDRDGQPSYVINGPVAWDAIPQPAEGDEIVPMVDAVCFGTLGQRHPCSRATIRGFLEYTRPECLRVFDVNFRDPAVDDSLLLESLERSNVVKVNDEELARISGVLGLHGDDADRIEQLAARFALRAVAVTMGARGCRIFVAGRHAVHPGFTVPVVDTVGAGDAFAAAFAIGLLRGHPPERIARDANELAARVCQSAGAWDPQVHSSRATS
jgi:fructokinase